MKTNVLKHLDLLKGDYLSLMGWVVARDVYSAVLEKTPYPIRMLMSFGGNLLASQPETDRAKSAFFEA